MSGLDFFGSDYCMCMCVCVVCVCVCVCISLHASTQCYPTIDSLHMCLVLVFWN